MNTFHITGNICPEVEGALFQFAMPILSNGGGDVKITINSIGGNLDSAISIYSLLTSTPLNVTTFISGTCQSAATLIFLAGSSRKIHPFATLGMHGPARNIDERMTLQVAQEMVKQLEIDNESMISVFMKSLGKPREDVIQYFERDFYFGADEAVEAGIATEVSDEPFT